MSEKAVSTMTADDLKALAAMANPDDLGGDLPKIPVLKINYDAESVYPRGAWVVGQQKDADGNIIEQGRLVKGFVIIATRTRYSMYVQGDQAKCCASQLVTLKEPAFGSNYGFNCRGGECPHRATDAVPRCKAQIVAFGVALTDTKEQVECMTYIQGSSYMPFSDHLQTLREYKEGAIITPTPPFAYITILGSEKKKNAGTIYFPGTFQRSGLLPRPQIQYFQGKRQGVYDLIEMINSRFKRSSGDAMKAVKVAAPAEAPPAAPAASHVIDADFESVTVASLMAGVTPPETVASTVSVAKPPAAEADMPVGAGEDFDIEATIAAALRG